MLIILYFFFLQLNNFKKEGFRKKYSIIAGPIIIKYRCTVVTTNMFLFYDMINIMFLNLMVT